MELPSTSSLRATGTKYGESSSHTAAALSENPTLNRLYGLFQKMKQGNDFTSGDRAFLEEASKRTASNGEWVSSFFFTPSDESTVQRITTLSGHVLGGRISSDDLIANIEQFFDGRTTITARETASIANLITTCVENDPSFDQAIKGFLDKNKQKPPFRDDLIDIVTALNRVELPKPSKAGTVVARVQISVEAHELPRTLEVRYNAQGHLEIIDGAVAPMDVSCSQRISTAELQQMQKIYTDLTAGTYFNNLGMVLEFAKFVRTERALNPHITLDQAFQKFNPNLVGMFDKYKSGNCGVFANKFCHEVERQMGIKGQRLAKVTENAWTGIPLPGTEESQIKWNRFSQEVQGADHTNVGFPFTSEDGREDYIQFACSFEKDREDEISHHKGNSRQSGLDRFFKRSGYTRSFLPDRILDDSHIGKSGLKARFKAAMSNGGKTMGVDFLRGNFYLNPSWAKADPGLPRNSRGMASIDLTDLANPDSSATYTVDGKEVVITHRQALRIMLEKASSFMEIPADMGENIISTAQIAPLMNSQLYIQPLPFIQEHYADLQEIGKKYNAMKPTMEKVLSPEESEKFMVIQKHYDAMVDHLALEYDPEKALAEIVILKKLLA
jgi:hypothetical protein